MKLAIGHDVPAYALQDPCTGELSLAHVCQSEREALELRRQMAIHHPHKPRPRVLPVLVNITRMDD